MVGGGLRAGVARLAARSRDERSEDIRTSLLAGVAGTLGLNVAALGLNFLSLILLTKVLSVEGYGAYVYALGWMAALGVPALAGLPQVVVREVAVAQAGGDHALVHGMVRRALQWASLASVAVVALGVVGALWIGRGQPEVHRAYLLALLLIPVVALYKVNESVLRGYRRVVQGRVAEALVQPGLLVAALIVVQIRRTDHPSAGLAVGLTLAAAVSALAVSAALVRRAVPVVVRHAAPRYEAKAWWRSAKPLFVHSGAGAVHVQASLLLVGALDGVTSSGVYSVAFRWAAFVTFVQTAVNYPFAPLIARLHQSGDRARLQVLLRRAAMVTTAAALPVAVSLILLRQRALGAFGPQFTSGGRALIILVVGEVINVACGLTTATMAMTGQERPLAWTTMSATGLNILLAVVLIPPMGVTGAAWARAISVVWLQVALAWQMGRRFGLSTTIFGAWPRPRHAGRSRRRSGGASGPS